MPLIRGEAKSTVRHRAASESEEVDGRRQNHVQRDDVRDVEEDRARRLAHGVNSVHDGVKYPRDTGDSDEPAGDSNVRLGEDEEEADDEKGDDVLEVVQMRASNSVNVFVALHFQAFHQRAVLWIHHGLPKQFPVCNSLSSHIPLPLTLFLKRWTTVKSVISIVLLSRTQHQVTYTRNRVLLAFKTSNTAMARNEGNGNFRTFLCESQKKLWLCGAQ
jgi:hypothetical protein